MTSIARPRYLGLAIRIEAFGDDPGQPGDELIIDRPTHTLRRWSEKMADRETDERWRYLGPHDLRRTWGHLSLEAEVFPSVVTQWGGWEDYPTFQRHYLGKHGEIVQSREAEKIDWL